jgi:hypothetical protein
MNPLTPYLTYIKVGAAVLVVGAIFGGGVYVGALRSKTALEADHAAQLKSLADAWQARELTYEGQTKRYANEIEILRATRAQPLPGTPLRVCFNPPAVLPASPAGGSQPAVAGTLPRRDDGVPRGDADQRPGLFAIADEADDVLAKCRRTQPVKH